MTDSFTTENVWRTSTPEEQGVDPAGIRALIDALEADPSQDPHALVIVRQGAVVASVSWAPYGIRRPQLLYSLSKSFTSTAAGFAAAEGLLDLDAPAADYFPEYADAIAPASRRILVRHLASMATGHEVDMIERVIAADAQRPVRAFLSMAPEHEPGTIFTYNQPATYTLAAIIQKQTGMPLTDYLRPRLLEPLGIPPIGWQQQPAGVDLGFSGLFSSAEAVAKLGRLYLDGGVWDGRRLLPEWWVREATSKQIDNSRYSDWGAESRQGYGFQFWMSTHGYRGDGAFGQFCLVLPEHDTVVALTSLTSDMQLTMRTVWNTLLPALQDAPLEPRGGDVLLGEVRALGFPRAGTPTVTGFSDLAADAAGEYRMTASGFRADYAGEHEDFEGFALERVDGAWHATIRVSGGTVGGVVGDGEWVVSEGEVSGTLGVPVALRGGILSGGDSAGSGVLHVEAAFIDTPHRLTMDFDPATHAVTPDWGNEGAPLRFTGALVLRAVRPGETTTLIQG